jgi:multiple sugar transport system substrate-binding protein
MSKEIFMRLRSFAASGLAIALATVALGGCSASTSTSGSDGADSGPVTLQYWAWAPKSQEIVDEWNKENPDIQVKYTDAGGGSDSAPKLLTASRAGNAPDVALVEYPTLTSMIVADVPLDITKQTDDIRDKFTEGTWAQTTFDGAVYGIPQDVGPMAMTYRQDLLAKYGIPVPATWADFKTAAAAVRAADPNAYLASFPPTEWGTFAGIAAQAGSQWWSVKDNKWTIGIADDASLQVADYFQDLADEDLIKTDPLMTPEYDKGLNDGTILSWPSALWAPGVVYGVAPDTAGDWALAPLPQWTAGDPTVSYQGGSAIIVTKNSKHADAAIKFAKWYNASEAGAGLILNKQNAYPAAISGQQAAESEQPPALMPQQTDFYKTASAIASKTSPVTWGPDTDLAQTTFSDALGKAIANHTPWRDAFIATQKAVVDDMKTNGFDLTNK